jgi:tetratricopeptide (TPR) repeat protein
MLYYKAGALRAGFFIYPTIDMDLSELDIENLAARLIEDPRSPLFARLADLYLSRDRVGEAVALCERGTALYPTYAGGHIVLGKCYQQLGAVGKARASYLIALGLSPYNTVLQRLLISLLDEDGETTEPSVENPQIAENTPAAEAPSVAQDVLALMPFSPGTENITRAEQAPADAPPIETDHEQWHLIDDVTEPATESVMEPQHAPEMELSTDSQPSAEAQPPVEVQQHVDEQPPAEPQPTYDPYPTFEQYIDRHPITEPTMTLEEYLKSRTTSQPPEPPTDFDSLAKKLQNAKRLIPTDVPIPPPSNAGESTEIAQAIISPTMAEIYVSQNEFDAAISAYESLINRQPEQSVLFGKRIDEIKELKKNISRP